MNKRAILVLIGVAALVALLAGCVVQDSPAPGCMKVIGPAVGGCAGKTAILDVEVAPQVDCLIVSANNCNGGVLEVRNRCGDPLALGGIEIAPGESASLDVAEQGGAFAPVETSSNFSDYAPTQDQHVELAGTLGAQPVTVAFTKTAPLCK